jgi:hypothetical protein
MSMQVHLPHTWEQDPAAAVREEVRQARADGRSPAVTNEETLVYRPVVTRSRPGWSINDTASSDVIDGQSDDLVGFVVNGTALAIAQDENGTNMWVRDGISNNGQTWVEWQMVDGSTFMVTHGDVVRCVYVDHPKELSGA